MSEDPARRSRSFSRRAPAGAADAAGRPRRTGIRDEHRATPHATAARRARVASRLEAHTSRAAVGRARPVDAELASKLARVRRLEPIPISASHASPASNSWERVDVNAWGRRLTADVQRRGGNCLVACCANLLGATDISQVPDNSDLQAARRADWLEVYSDRLADRVGHRLQRITADQGLASKSPWIAVIDDGDTHHAVVCVKDVVRFDPAGELQAPSAVRTMTRRPVRLRPHHPARTRRHRPPSNWQGAHRTCNGRKGARLGNGAWTHRLMDEQRTGAGSTRARRPAAHPRRRTRVISPSGAFRLFGPGRRTPCRGLAFPLGRFRQRHPRPVVLLTARNERSVLRRPMADSQTRRPKPTPGVDDPPGA